MYFCNVVRTCSLPGGCVRLAVVRATRMLFHQGVAGSVLVRLFISWRSLSAAAGYQRRKDGEISRRVACGRPLPKTWDNSSLERLYLAHGALQWFKFIQCAQYANGDTAVLLRLAQILPIPSSPSAVAAVPTHRATRRILVWKRIQASTFPLASKSFPRHQKRKTLPRSSSCRYF